jgi:cation:H+ antiporter
MMEMSLPIASLVALGGIVLLGLGAAWLVDGASRLALRFGLSPMVVGLTVVGFGTSMPEFMVSILAAMRGSGAMSVGNAVGSNVMNLWLVLGVSAVIRPMIVVGRRSTMARDLVFGLVPAGVLLVAAWNGDLGRPVALTLIAVFAVFMGVAVVGARQEKNDPVVVAGSVGAHLAKTTAGIVALTAGAEALVRGGSTAASFFGISEAVIGLTLVAFGTSLPELATSVAAAFKGEAELSVGNVLGSNVFNLGLIVGTAFTIRPGPVPSFIIQQDVPILGLATVVVGAMVVRNRRISRIEGGLLFAFFVAYMVFVGVRGGS